MRKPRYTPDPPPHNATPEQLMAWANAQFQRIEDYWPQDYGERVAALEQIQSVLRQTGNWSISGQSNVRFEGTVTQVVTDPAYLMWTLGGTSISESDYDAFPSFIGQGWSAAREIESDQLGTIVAVDFATLYKSTDAVTWSDCSDSNMSGSYTQSVVWTGQKWVLVGHPSGVAIGYRISSSDDLATWTEKTTHSGTYNASALRIASDGGGTVVAAVNDAGDSNKTRILYSTDHGENWTLTDVVTASSATRFDSVFYVNGAWFGLGYSKTIYRASSPGGTWSLVSSTGSSINQNLSIAYGDGLYLVAQNDAATPRLLSSANGQSWTDEGAWYSTESTKALFFDDADKWIFVSGGQQLKSSDGSSWSTITNNFPALSVRGVTKIYRTPT